ncbi:MAG: GH92 family glycosyl hydrolase [Deltaproteobacteria bacterium]
MGRRALFAIALLAGCGDDAPPQLPEVTRATTWVDPRIGTGGLGYAYGSCFVGASAPHGLAKPGPDTNGNDFGTISFQHYSGYFAGDNRIQGFSSLHLHGTGATDYGILSVMPTLAFDPAKTSVVNYEAHFAKADEHAGAGYYAVTLDSGIQAELTASQRVAVERYTLPSAGTLVIDLAKTLSGGMVDAREITVDDAAGEITGSMHHLGGMSAGFGGYTLYYVIHGTWTSSQTWTTGAALAVPAGATTIAIGMSLVSLEGARANLAAEVPTVDFDAVHDATTAAWEHKLGVVKITAETEAQLRTFYTSLYHSFLMPSVIGDVDGTYVLAHQMPVVAQGYDQMSDLSLWDTYRDVAPLYAWLAPDSARDTARSLFGFASGLGAYPKWPLAIGETGTMLGASAEIVIADAQLRGVPDSGAADAWATLRAAAMDPTAPAGGRGGRNDVEAYIQYGYVPDTTGRSVSETTEYAHDDFALANLAGALGNTADHDALLARSKGWRKLYDPTTGFLRGRGSDGSVTSKPFDEFVWADDYAEADAWQSLWMAGVHDPDGIATILGGKDAAVAKLTEFFTQAKTDWETSDPSAANFPRKWYWAGNEPDLNAPFLFGQLGHPELTDQWVRWVEDTIYTDQPDGVPGNDDGGAMGSWYVLATLGLYPVAGSDQWLIGMPRFVQARVTVGGHELLIVREGNGTHVQSVTLDGADVLTGLTQAQLVGGSKLVFTTSN